MYQNKENWFRRFEDVGNKTQWSQSNILAGPRACFERDDDVPLTVDGELRRLTSAERPSSSSSSTPPVSECRTARTGRRRPDTCRSRATAGRCTRTRSEQVRRACWRATATSTAGGATSTTSTPTSTNFCRLHLHRRPVTSRRRTKVRGPPPTTTTRAARGSRRLIT